MSTTAITIHPSRSSSVAPAEGRETMIGNLRKVRTTEDCELLDSQTSDIFDFLDFVDSCAALQSPADITWKAVRSFRKLIGMLPVPRLDAESLRLWIVRMTLADLTPSTRKRYFGKIHSLYLSYSSHSPETDPFISASDTLRDMPESFPAAAMEADRRRLAAIFPRLVREADENPVVAAFLFMLFYPEAGFGTMAQLTFADTLPQIERVGELVEAQRKDPRQKFVFRIGQTANRTPRVIKDLSAQMATTLRGYGLSLKAGFSADAIRSLWVAQALHEGVPVKQIVEVMPTLPAPYAFLSVIAPSAGLARGAMRRVADSLGMALPRWHVMKLRRGIDPLRVEEAAREAAPKRGKNLAFYYPVKRVARREKKKIVFDEVPYIPDLLFFKVRHDCVADIFRAIGDLAWCYRVSNAPGSEYSIIADGEMHAFQRMVGQFTPDISLTLTEDRTLGPGRRVRITGGVMKGYEGVIHDIKTPAGSQTPPASGSQASLASGSHASSASGKTEPTASDIRVFTLTLAPDAALRWEVAIEESLIEAV